jgi:hypothetical protein
LGLADAAQIAGAAGDFERQRSLQMAASKVSLVTSSGSILRQQSLPQQSTAPAAKPGGKAVGGSGKSAKRVAESCSEPPSSKKQRGSTAASVRSSASVAPGGPRKQLLGGSKRGPGTDTEVLAVDAGADGDNIPLDKLIPQILGLKEYSPGRELRWVFIGRKFKLQYVIRPASASS